ncbi:MAG: hypothetical protein AAB611_03655 [Patescibacteria group bacterium]
MRQTLLSLSDLIVAVDNGDHPRCLFVNEIGEVYSNSKVFGESEVAMRKLIELLHDSDSRVRYIAYCALSFIPNRSREVFSALSSFRLAIENSDVMANARELLLSRLGESLKSGGG